MNVNEFSLGEGRDLLVVLRRYEVSDAPWGVHIVSINFDTLADRFSGFESPITNRPVGLFSSERVSALLAENQLHRYQPSLATGDPITLQGWRLLQQYIWTQVVPFEWIDEFPTYCAHLRVYTENAGAHTDPAMFPDDDFIATWDNLMDRSA